MTFDATSLVLTSHIARKELVPVPHRSQGDGSSSTSLVFTIASVAPKETA